MLMALVLETPYNRHWHSKVVQLGLLQLSPLTVGLLWISQHCYRRRKISCVSSGTWCPPSCYLSESKPEVLDKTCCFFYGCLGVGVLLLALHLAQLLRPHPDTGGLIDNSVECLISTLPGRAYVPNTPRTGYRCTTNPSAPGWRRMCVLGLSSQETTAAGQRSQTLSALVSSPREPSVQSHKVVSKSAANLSSRWAHLQQRVWELTFCSEVTAIVEGTCQQLSSFWCTSSRMRCVHDWLADPVPLGRRWSVYLSLTICCRRSRTASTRIVVVFMRVILEHTFSSHGCRFSLRYLAKFILIILRAHWPPLGGRGQMAMAVCA